MAALASSDVVSAALCPPNRLVTVKDEDSAKASEELFENKRQRLPGRLDTNADTFVGVPVQTPPVHVAASSLQEATMEASGRTEPLTPPSALRIPYKPSPEAAWEYFRKLGSPKLHVAPMVDASELPFRLLCRKWGADAAYTPMIHSRMFLEDRKNREEYFSTCPEDRPLFAQFCANDPALLLQAARIVEHQCDYIDINLGCPQRIAKRGRYGAFLMEDLPLIRRLVTTLIAGISIPVSCKIRIFPDIDETVEYAKMLEDAGCALLAVHGRTRDQKSPRMRANWDAIRAVKQALRIPVLANGNVRWLEDAEECMRYTGADGILSAEGLLGNPAMFAGVRMAEDVAAAAAGPSGGQPDLGLVGHRLLVPSASADVAIADVAVAKEGASEDADVAGAASMRLAEEANGSGRNGATVSERGFEQGLQGMAGVGAFDSVMHGGDSGCEPSVAVRVPGDAAEQDSGKTADAGAGSELGPKKRARTGARGAAPDQIALALEYMDLCERYPVPMRMVRGHVHRMLGGWFRVNTDLRDRLNRERELSLAFIREICRELEERKAKDPSLRPISDFTEWANEAKDPPPTSHVSEFPTRSGQLSQSGLENLVSK